MLLTRIRNNFTNLRIEFRPGELYRLMHWPTDSNSKRQLRVGLDRLRSVKLKYENSWSNSNGEAYEKEFTTGILDSYKLTTLKSGQSHRSARYRSKQNVGEVVFCCVDTILARAAIWRSLKGTIEFWCDGRMMGETIRVISATQSKLEHYASALFSPAGAQPGNCTARSTVYAASIAAGLMLQQFVSITRGGEPLDQLWNLTAGEHAIIAS